MRYLLEWLSVFGGQLRQVFWAAKGRHHVRRVLGEIESMSLQVALLRAINVGGTGKLAMADLRAWIADMGFQNAKTVLQSGNIVLDSNEVAGTDLEEKLERVLEKRFNLRGEVIVRSPEQWAKLISQNPMKPEARTDPSHLLLLFGKHRITREGIDRLEAVIADKGGRETVRTHGAAAYMFFPDGIGTSRVTTKLINVRWASPSPAEIGTLSGRSAMHCDRLPHLLRSRRECPPVV
jgi:uncharacterized protein (DUF1697 family)